MYKIKHIVALNPNLLKGRKIYLDIEDSIYSFKIDDVKTSIIEFTAYFPHEDIRNEMGPIEKKLLGITYGKSKSQMETWQYVKSFTEFKMFIGNDPFKFEVKGVGEVSVKVNLYVTFKQIDEAKSNLCKELKSTILDLYESEINRNKNKLDELKRKDEKEEAEREKIREEQRKREEKLKERFKDIEHLL